MKVLAVVVLLAFLAGSFRLLRYCLENRRTHLRVFLASWFLLLAGLLLRLSWTSFTVHRPHESLGEAIGGAVLGVISLAGTGLFCGLAFAYLAPTIWRVLQKRRDSSFTDGSLSSATGTVPFGWPESLLLTSIVLPVLGLNWLVLVLAFPMFFYRVQTDQPLPWLRITTSPKAAQLGGRALTWTETIVYIQSPSGQWSAVAFPRESHSRHLTIFSPDAVLITTPASVRAMYNTVDGAVYLKGSPEPVVSIPASDDIAAIPSGGITAARCEPHPRCENEFCRSCASLTVERYDGRGTLISSAKLAVANDDRRPCDWFPVHRLMGDDLVYSVYHCPLDSHLTGYYRVSPEGLQRITSRVESNEYTAVEDKSEMESQTQPVTWYHVPWIPAAM
jgi:hypothetical protein